MPTGVPLADGREQLFDAARRVLLRGGSDALTSRAVTAEAGVAKGVLHRYFADFDAFLAALAVVELERIDARSAELRGTAGDAAVADNLTDALCGSLTPEVLSIADLAVSRHALLARLRLATPTGIPLLAQITTMVSAYLTAERGLGRLPLETDVDRLALMLVGGAHLLVAADAGAGEVRELVATGLAGGRRDLPDHRRRRGLPGEPVRVGERAGVRADRQPRRAAALLVDAGILGQRAATVERERHRRAGVELDVLAPEALGDRDPALDVERLGRARRRRRRAAG